MFRSQKTKNAVGYFASALTLGLAAAIIGPTLPQLAKNTNTTLADVSSIFLARSIGYLFSAFYSGFLYDKFSGHKILFLALFGMAVAMLLIPISSFLWVLAFALVLLGAASSTTDIGCNTLIIWTFDRGLTKMMNTLHFCFGFGALIAPLVVVWLATFGGVIGSYWAIGTVMLLTAIWVVFARCPVMPIKTDSKEGNKVDLFFTILIALFYVFYVGVEISFGSWIFTYCLRQNLANEAIAAYLTTTFWGFFTFGRLVCIPLAVRFAPKNIIRLNLIGGIVLTGIMMANQNSLVIIWFGASLLGLSLAAVVPTLLVFVSDSTKLTGKAMSIIVVGASIGSMILPWLVGQMFETIGPQSLFVSILISLICALGVFLFILSRTLKNLPKKVI